MVGGAVVFEVVGADFLAAVAAAYLGQPGGALLGVGFCQLALIELGPQDFHGALAVLQLGALLGAEHPNAGGLVQQVYGRFNFVDVLAAGATGAGGTDFDVAGFDLNLHGIGLRHHGDRGG